MLLLFGPNGARGGLFYLYCPIIAFHQQQIQNLNTVCGLLDYSYYGMNENYVFVFAILLRCKIPAIIVNLKVVNWPC